MKIAFRLVCPGVLVMRDFIQESPPLSRHDRNVQYLLILLHSKDQGLRTRRLGEQTRGFYTRFESKRLVSAGKAFSLTVPR